jgi:hypothetical protein
MQAVKICKLKYARCSQYSAVVLLFISLKPAMAATGSAAPALTAASDFRARIAGALSSLSGLTNSTPAATSGRKRTRIEALVDQYTTAPSSPEQAAAQQAAEDELCKPFSISDFHRRLGTFRVRTWFGKPESLSPLRCAAKGWLNISSSKLQCECCKAELAVDIAVSSGVGDAAPAASLSLDSEGRKQRETDFVERLSTAHAELCPWRTAICPWHFYMPMILPPHAHTAYIRAQALHYKDMLKGSPWYLKDSAADTITTTAQRSLLRLVSESGAPPFAPSKLTDTFCLALGLGTQSTNTGASSDYLLQPAYLPVILPIFGWEAVGTPGSITWKCRCCDATLKPSDASTEVSAFPTQSETEPSSSEGSVLAAARKAMAAASRALAYFKSSAVATFEVPYTPAKRARTAAPANTATTPSDEIDVLQQHKSFCHWIKFVCPVPAPFATRVKTLLLSTLREGAVVRLIDYPSAYGVEVRQALAALTAAAFGAASPSFLAGLFNISDDTARSLPHSDTFATKESIYADVAGPRDELWPGWLLSWSAVAVELLHVTQADKPAASP